MSKKLTPVKDDDVGNLVKAGYKENEMGLAMEHFKTTVRENPEMSGLTFSQYIYQIAALNIVFDTQILPSLEKK